MSPGADDDVLVVASSARSIGVHWPPGADSSAVSNHIDVLSFFGVGASLGCTRLGGVPVCLGFPVSGPRLEVVSGKPSGCVVVVVVVVGGGVGSAVATGANVLHH